MAKFTTIKSPFKQADCEFHTDGNGLFCLKHINHSVPDMWINDSLKTQIEGNNLPQEFGVRQAEIDKAWWLIRSLLWRHSKRGGERHLVLGCREDETATAKSNKFLSFEKCLVDSGNTTFQDMWIETLENLIFLDINLSESPEIPYARTPKKEGTNEKLLYFDPGKVVEDGQAFCCNEIFAAKVYQYLNGCKYIELRDTARNVLRREGFCVTPKAIEFIEKHRSKGFQRRKNVFVVVSAKQDEVLKELWIQLSKSLGFSVSPVWGKEHNEKIDDRIFRKLRESSAVIVDVSPDRYNVGFEHGYALGLKKQIIVMKEEGRGRNKHQLPFDIQSHNCLFYKVTKVTKDGKTIRMLAPEVFEYILEKLKARIDMAHDLSESID